jgi:SAM-dependent methyltransferase
VSDGRNSAYDSIPYLGVAVPLASPLHLSLCSLAARGPSPPLCGFRLAELGCGDGTSLIPLAFYHPGATFVGIDNSCAQLDSARSFRECLSLQNVHLVRRDVRDLEPSDFAPCDYVIAHGLYSWVSEDTRDVMLEFCQRALSPSGLAYISYNAQPGWATRRLVRETLLRARSVREAPIEQKAYRAIEDAARLLEDLHSRDYASAILLAEELERVRNAKPGYVFHEYLAEVNDGFWLGQFVERARRHGLDYVCDAQFGRWEGHVPDELKSKLAARGLDAIEQEETADLLCHRYFRASILCRADAPRSPVSRRDLVEQVYLATSLTAKSDPFDLTHGAVERFRGAGGIEVTIGASVTKAAVLLMAAQWPAGSKLEQLCEKSTELLAEHGFETPADPRSQLIDDLIPLFEAGQVDFHLREPSFGTEIRDYPRVHALARFEAAHRDSLTTPYHVPLAFDPQTLALVRTLDGSRSLSQLQHVFGDKLVAQAVSVLARWGLVEPEQDTS